MREKLFFVLIFIFFCDVVWAEINIEKEIDLTLTNKYDRVLKYTALANSNISFLFNDIFTVTGGVSVGGNNSYTQTLLFASGELSFKFLNRFFKYIFLNILYTFEGIKKYYLNTNAIIYTASIKGKYGGFSLGFHNLWSIYYDEYKIKESGLAFMGYVTVLNKKQFALDLVFANYDLLYATAYFGAYFLGINTLWKVNKNVAVNNDLNVYQSGSAGLTSTFYGISLNSGVKISW
ncbi:MAG: hypothetical protein Ta2F_06640 [Termitinemataceae bacterium]|nr:MAG: hypothetical protein Ta2F_06640 [Termitinemataceae bacterium]